MFKSLSSKETNKTLKSEQTFFLDKSTKVERKIDKKQHQMENDVMKHIEDSWDNKRRLCRTLVFRCTRKKCSWFKGGPSSKSHSHHMKAWFYQGFIRRNNLSHTRVAGISRKLPHYWKEKCINTTNRVAQSQMHQKKGRNISCCRQEHGEHRSCPFSSWHDRNAFLHKERCWRKK